MPPTLSVAGLVNSGNSIWSSLSISDARTEGASFRSALLVSVASRRIARPYPNCSCLTGAYELPQLSIYILWFGYGLPFREGHNVEND
jgi:hypothetical protein